MTRLFFNGPKENTSFSFQQAWSLYAALSTGDHYNVRDTMNLQTIIIRRSNDGLIYLWLYPKPILHLPKKCQIIGFFRPLERTPLEKISALSIR